MLRLRIGNDLPIRLRFSSLGSAVDLSRERSVSVRIISDSGVDLPFEYGIRGNEVFGNLRGKNQKQTGIYTARVILNEGLERMYSIDVPLVMLVDRTYKENSSEGREQSVGFCAYNDTLDIWGRDGISGDDTSTCTCSGSAIYKTQIDNSLSVEVEICIAKNGLSAYEIALVHGFEGTEEEWLESLKGESVTREKVIELIGFEPANSTEVIYYKTLFVRNGRLFTDGVVEGDRLILDNAEVRNGTLYLR